MQQSSFFIVLTCDKDAFTGRLSCSYDRVQRLSGYWEVALVDFSKTENPLYVLCDLIYYSYVDNYKVQLLCYVSPPPNNRTPNYIKLMNKRYSAINIDIKKSINSDVIPQLKENITCM